MWDWGIWGALVASALAVIGALGLLAARALQAWSGFNDARRDSAAALAELGAKGEETATKASETGDTTELQQSVARLRLSLGRLAVLREAIAEAEAVVPRL